MKLQKKILSILNSNKVVLPNDTVFALPEKILQFGTGVLLRGLPDYFVDKANRKGIFNGRIVAVKSTTNGSVDNFNYQDNLYTIATRGFKNGNPFSENSINASISRVLNANTEWDEILKCAENPEMKIVFSNTTESGLVLVEENIFQSPPASFPAKLLAFLHCRYTFFKSTFASGMIIVPTELIPDNGKKLKEFVLSLAVFNNLDKAFIHWLQTANYFCNSLVDRIVPGYPQQEQLQQLYDEIEYEDKLLLIAEPYSLWAIEGDETIREVLSFCNADNSVVIQNNINEFRELKLRLLNGTHTLCCGPAVLAGFDTVSAAMENERFSDFMEKLMKNEIAPAIAMPINESKKNDFINQLLNRFRNPTIGHQWLSITMNYTAKMKMRVVPLLLQYYQQGNAVPPLMVESFAAYIRFMKVFKTEGDKYYGNAFGKEYHINDISVTFFDRYWKESKMQDLVIYVLQNKDFWGVDLTVSPGFVHRVTAALIKLDTSVEDVEKV